MKFLIMSSQVWYLNTSIDRYKVEAMKKLGFAFKKETFGYVSKQREIEKEMNTAQELMDFISEYGNIRLFKCGNNNLIELFVDYIGE